MPNPSIRWSLSGIPYSIAFNDKYFCSENGYEEVIHVSCKGNFLQERLSKLDPNVEGTFTIIETGFGSGLSFCAAWEMFDQCAPLSWKLHFISIELFPMASEDLDRALNLWPNLKVYQELLVAKYKFTLNGIEEFRFNDGRVCLTIVFEHVVTALKIIKDKQIAPQKADAWFLNGFAPFKNPEMWSEEVFSGMAPLSKPGTTLATFTVAGFVRRGLEVNGFAVQKLPGHGKKKEILSGVFK